MSVRRVGWLAGVALATLLWMSCGQVYRPVVIPVSTTPPNPANFHAVFGISTNPSANPGSALQIDVSGDTKIGVAPMGINPTHAVYLSASNRVFVASSGSWIPGQPDIVTSFTPIVNTPLSTGITTQSVYSLPNVGPEQSAAITTISETGNLVTVTLSAPIGMATVGGPIVISGVSIGAYDGNFVIASVSGTTITYVDNAAQNLATTSGGTATVPVPTFCSYLPDFVATAQNSAVFVANYGAENGANCSFASTDSVALLSPANGTITNIAYLNNPPTAGPAPHPVALTETPNGQNLYVVNQGDGATPSTVVNLSPTDLSRLATITVGINPTWAVARADNQRVYVLTQGDGMLVPIDVNTNTVLPSQTNLSVGAGANFLLYDANLNRLYVTNPSTGNVFVFSTTGGVDLSGTANDTPKLLATISMTGAANPPCPKGCSPVSVAALPDGSRFYVASYQSEAACSDPNVGAAPCIVPILTVFDAPSMKVRPVASTLLPSSPSLSLLSSPPFSSTQYAVPPVGSCAPPTIYTPGTTRFRMFTTASADSSHVYVSICDAGSIASVSTTTNTISQGTNAPDTLITDIAAPFGACTGPNCSFASITSFSIASNIVTFQAANKFLAGEQIQVAGLAIGTYLNGQVLTVLPNGLSGSQFEASFTHADVGTTADSGTAASVAPPPATITAFSINSNVVTFQAVNAFTTGTRVAISGLSSSAATSAALDGRTLTVIATGLSGTQFECVLPTAQTNVGATPDSGIAVPQVSPQTPIFLLTGQ